MQCKHEEGLKCRTLTDSHFVNAKFRVLYFSRYGGNAPAASYVNRDAHTISVTNVISLNIDLVLRQLSIIESKSN